MSTTDIPAEVAVLLTLLDRAFDRRSWHGPNLRSSIRGLSARVAAWRPTPDRKSIAEHVLHAAYWKYVVRRRLAGLKRGSFPLAGSNWFPVPDDLPESDWRGHIKLLESEHRALRLAVSGLTPDDLRDNSLNRPLAMVQGIAFHDIYHAGQIGLLKRLRDGD
jgi:hypothetical protein